MKAFTDTLWLPGQPKEPTRLVLSPQEASERLLYLEKRYANMSVDDIPVADLQRKMEQSWQPDAATLLPNATITVDQLGESAKPLKRVAGNAVTGTGAAVPAALTTLGGTPAPGLSATILTPNVPTYCEVRWKVRLDTAIGAWFYVYTACNVSPAPVWREHSGSTLTGLVWLHAGGPFGVQSVASEWFELAPGTIYTFTIQGVCGAAASVVYSANPENDFSVWIGPKP